MPQAIDASPQLQVTLIKTISRSTIDGQFAVSGRYQGKRAYIDLTEFLHLGSSVRTSKSVRQPAGAFSISFADKPETGMYADELESLSGLIEPMDIVEIRMWGGRGPTPSKLPIVMRGFVSRISRQRMMDDQGRPQRIVTVTGMDYGKVWQTFQVLYMPAYAQDIQSLLTSFNLWELFGIQAKNTMPAAEFIRTMVEKVINPHMQGFIPADMGVPQQLTLGDGISVAHGVISNSYQNSQGSLYDIMRFHGDVGVWNELYTEDREDGVHVVYRPIPAYLLSTPGNRASAKIQDDAPDPPMGLIPDYLIKSMEEARSDDNVANFYWVNNSRFDLIDDIVRKQYAIGAASESVSLENYPNAAKKYYGVRAMYAETQQGGDGISYMGTGLLQGEHDARRDQQQSWIDSRRRIMMEMNKDNVVYDVGVAVLKGGPLRSADGSGTELLKAGDYALFQTGSIAYSAYAHQIDHEFLPFQSYTTTVRFDRGEGFVTKASMEGSPWLSEQAS
ncbi:hypothetical protein [Tardiphaga sp. 862_B3_N1_1]|uniref:hypothetical protein n=1 Tax=Tardiphaga sp. 862_B3_N1_1 TaxID=3240763 RepID=UPI003F8A9438